MINIYPMPETYIEMLNRVPVNVSYLAPVPDEIMALTSIGFKWNDRSQHLSIDNFQPPSYYEDYVMTSTYSKKMQALQRAQMEQLITLCVEAGSPIRSFIEVGCGDGSFMKYVQKRVPRVLGIEPSAPFAKEAIEQGLEVIIGFVGSENLLTSEKFDSFASRQVFEHLPDPLDVLIGIRRMLNPGAVGLIEVPNGYRALRLKRFFEFFPDHVNYYSINSLVAIASDAGFNVIACKESFGGDYLELWLRNEPKIKENVGEMVLHREKVIAAMTIKIMELSNQGKKVVLWGCGAKTLSILSASPSYLLPNIVGIIDSDPHKHGRYVPNTAIQVVAPDQGSKLAPDVVLILALSYSEEIAASIRSWIPACGLILSLDDRGQIIEL